MSCIITYKGNKYTQEQFKEYISNNKNEFSHIIASNKNVIDSFKRKMEGIDYVFSQSPELASIGSKAQYLQYLSTIFPNSKVRDIVYHGTVYNILNKKFDISRAGNSTLGYAKAAFFTNNKKWAWERFAFNDRMLDGSEEGNFLFYALLNIKNPTRHNTVFDFNKSVEEGFIENLHQDLYGEIISSVPLSRFSSNGDATTKQNQALINYDRDTYDYNIIYISGIEKETKIVNLFGKKIKQEVPKKISKEEFEASLTAKGREIYTDSINKINSYFRSKKEDISKAIRLEKSTIRTPGINKGSDSVISKQTDGTTLEYAVFEPEQIHILSSKKDLEMFKNFINFTKSEYAKYGDIQQFKDYMKNNTDTFDNMTKLKQDLINRENLNIYCV